MNGHALGTMGMNLVYMRDRGTEGAVSADGPDALVREIVASVRPTGVPC